MRRLRRRTREIAPDEIFLDASNLPAHEESQLEGRVGRPVSRVSVVGVGIVFALIGVAFAGRAFDLQVANGASFAQISRDNTLQTWPIFAQRGMIYDVHGTPLAWNVAQADSATSTATTTPYDLRQYISTPGFSLLLGFVSYPAEDAQGSWWRQDYQGITGVEQEFNTQLSGQNGATMVETDASGNVVRTNIVTPPQNGENITLSIDSTIQAQLYQYLLEHAQQQGFQGGAGVIMNVNTGQILAITSFPQYDNQAFTDGDAASIAAANENPQTPLLNRAIAGLYAPGSIVKPMEAAAALDEGIISPSKEIDSIGYISVPNPYDPSQPTLFHDWTAHGWIDMETAIAVSSDEYFYTIGGGYNGQQGLGIGGIDKYAAMFGFGTTTGIDLPGELPGVVPSPAWKAINFPSDPTWYLGDTYHSAIGQYGWQVTPIEAVRYAAAIANGGKLMTPTILASSTPQYTQIDIPDSDLAIARAGMRLSVTSTRSDAIEKFFNMPGIQLAGKTGTAQIGAHNEWENSVVIGFWPYNDPQYAFAVILQQADAGNDSGAAPAMIPFFQWLIANYPQCASSGTDC